MFSHYSVWLQTKWTGFSLRQRQRIFVSSLCAHTSSEAHPASEHIGTGSSFTGDKARPGRDAENSSLLVLRSKISRSYNSSSRGACMAWQDSFICRIYLWLYGFTNMVNNVRFQVLTAASMMFRIVFWDVLPCKIIVDRRFRGAYCLHYFTRQYIPEDNSEHGK
jgi:hypothetical protein